LACCRSLRRPAPRARESCTDIKARLWAQCYQKSSMTTDDRVLLISPSTDEVFFPLTLQRRDGERVALYTAGPSSWIAAVREQQWNFIVCGPELLREHAFERGQREVLERIAAGAPLPELLEQIVLLIEAQAPGMICSILLLDRDRGVLYTGAAPHLPTEFIAAIDGSKIGPTAGSCGTAAYRDEPVIVEDIASHEYWDEYRQLALPHGLRACWSTPIRSASRGVLGTFAMYYTEPRRPRPEEFHWVERATHIAAITLERAQADAEEHVHAVVHDLIADVVFYLAVEADGQCRFLSVNPAFCQSSGLRERDVVGRTVQEIVPEESLSALFDHGQAAIAERRPVVRYQVSPYPTGTKHGLMTMTPILSADGHRPKLLGPLHHIPDLHLSHQHIAAHAALLDPAHDAIMTWIPYGSIHYWNAAAERLYGWSRGEA